MSGLLRRLAARAIGQQAGAIHSLARMRYVAPLELAAEPMSEPAVQRSEPRSETVSQVTRVAAAPGSPPIQVPRRVASTSAPQTPWDSVPTVSRETARPSVHQSRPLSPEPAAEQAARDDVAERQTTGIDVTENDTGQPASDGPSRRWAIPSVLVSPGGEGSGTTADTPARQIMDSPRSPSRSAVPATPSERPQNASMPTGYWGAPARGRLMQNREPSEPDTTEVHVHIGRIEVTALQEAPAKQPKTTRQQRQPMSLDEYLTRRKEGPA